MTAVADWVRSQRGLIRWTIALILGGLAAYAMAPFFYWPLILIAYVGLIWLLDGSAGFEARRIRSGFVTGWFFGLGFFMAGLIWISEAFLVEADTFAWLVPIAMPLLTGGLAIFMGFAGALYVAVWRPGTARLLFTPVIFLAAEWLRGNVLTGFPWNLPAYAWGGQAEMMQLAAVVGSYGLSLITLLAASLIAAIGDPGGVRYKLIQVSAGVMLLMAQYAYGYGTFLSAPEPGSDAAARVRIVQPVIDQRIKWQPEHETDVVGRLLAFTRGSGESAGAQGITTVIWPESALPVLLARRADVMGRVHEAVGEGTRLITGQLRATERAESGYDWFNSVMVIDGGEITDVYDKVHLVPFGEYLPFRSILNAIGLRQITQARGAFTPGRGRLVLEVPGLPSFVPLICYEIIFPGGLPDVEPRPQMIVNVTNDAWFGETTGPHQHLTSARFRAVEEGLPVFRAANTGISAVIDPFGRVVRYLGINQPGYIDTPLLPARATTVYAVVGDWMTLGGATILVLIAFVLRISRLD